MLRFLAMICVLVMISGVALSERLSGEAFTKENHAFNGQIAQDALSLSMLSTAEDARAALTEAGFDIVLQRHYDKSADDLSDTCAYTVGKKTVTVSGREETLLLLSIRGTGAGEWRSNFDIADKDDGNPTYAKGFYLAAVDVMEAFAPIYEAEGRPYAVVTGYSRGAACANLVGVMMDDRYGGEKLYIYTFATPRTVRGDFTGEKYDNIFNVVSETDVVTQVPFAVWGFERAGRDIVLPGKADDVRRLDKGLETMRALAPTIEDYYNLKHSLTAPGTAEDGVSAFEWMNGLAEGVFNGSFSGDGIGQLMRMIQLSTDFTPFLSLLLTLSMNDMRLLKEVAMRHMPDTYVERLAEYISNME